MGFKDKWKEFWFRFKIFIWYLATEPIRQLHEFFRFFVKILQEFNKTLTWLYIMIAVVVLAFLKDNRLVAGFFLLALLLLFLLWEWERGYFMHKYREKIRRKVKKEFESSDLGDSLENNRKI